MSDKRPKLSGQLVSEGQIHAKYDLLYLEFYECGNKDMCIIRKIITLNSTTGFSQMQYRRKGRTKDQEQ